MNNHQDGEPRPKFSPEKIRRLRERFYIVPSCGEIISLLPFCYKPLNDIPECGHLRTPERGIYIEPEWIYHEGDAAAGIKSLSESAPPNAAKYLIYALSREFESIENGKGPTGGAPSFNEAAIACGIACGDEQDLRHQLGDIVRFFEHTFIYVPQAGITFPILEKTFPQAPEEIPAAFNVISLGHARAEQNIFPMPVIIPKALLAEEDAGTPELFAAMMIYSSMLSQGIEGAFCGEMFTWSDRFTLFNAESPLTVLRTAFNNLQAMGILERWDVTTFKPIPEWHLKRGPLVDLRDPHFTSGGARKEYYNFTVNIRPAVTLEA